MRNRTAPSAHETAIETAKAAMVDIGAVASKGVVSCR
jgi:hypothetical protein